MKKIIIILSLLFAIFSCGYEIIDLKQGDSIETVSNLDFNMSGSQINLKWVLPSSYPSDIIQPVSVFIRVTKVSKENKSEAYPLYNPSALNAGTFTIDGAPNNFTYDQYDPNFSYRFTVKIVGKVDITSVNYSNLRYSRGAIVEIK